MKYAEILLRLYIVVTIPIMLTLISSRTVMTQLFLQFEYNRPDFPEDDYGFTKEDRLKYAPYALNYILYNKDITYLGDLTFNDGSRLYEESELKHMKDVQDVVNITFGLLAIQLVSFVIMFGLLRKNKNIMQSIKQGAFEGGILTLVLIASIAIFAITMWDFFFTSFHQIFFEEGTWKFFYSDTLIRLFPEKFWFDASIVIGILTSVQAAILIYFLGRQKKGLVN